MERSTDWAGRTFTAGAIGRGLLLGGLLLGWTGCKGESPSLGVVEAEVAGVGQTLSIVLYGTDPEGDDLDYSMSHNVPDIGGTATLSARPDGTGLFTWTPTAAHVGQWDFEFSVSDGRGEASSPVAIEVRGAVGEGTQPVFRKPISTGVVLQLDKQDCVELEILVDDQDTPQLALTQEPPIVPGSNLSVDGKGREATWNWCPRRDQAAAMSRHDLVLAANDGENAPVTLDVIIAVRNRVQNNPACEGDPPEIAHDPTDFRTLQDLEITADVGDDGQLRETPLLLYVTEAPEDGVDLLDMKPAMVEMELAGGDAKSGTWVAHVPNPLTKADDDTKEAEIYYVITASDDDDPDTAECDHTIEAPDRGTFRAKVVRPKTFDDGTGDDKGGDAEGKGLCEPCSADVQCGSKDDRCIRPATGGDSFCSQGCSDDGCSEGYTCGNERITSVDGRKGRQCVPERGQCGAGTAEKPTCETEAGNLTIEAAEPLEAGKRPTTKMCPDSGKRVHHWYKVAVDEAKQITASVSGDGSKDEPDFDLALTNDEGLQLAVSNSLEKSEGVQTCLLPGDYFLHVATEPKDTGGVYLVTYELQTSDACTPAEPDSGGSDCCEVKGIPGCSDDAVSSCVCDEDEFCCDVAWDSACRAQVAALGCGTCDLPKADCCEADLLPGCSDSTVEACVCAQDDVCCDAVGGWDALCVFEVDQFGCGDCGGAVVPEDRGECCEENDTPGCNDEAVEACVCDDDDWCCDPDKHWDALCVSKVESLGCGTCGGGGPDKGECCDPKDTPGCNDMAVESCVCDSDSYCCDNKWDSFCVSKVDSLGCGVCAPPPDQICEETCSFSDDGVCDDGGPNSDFDVCDLGTDCLDCGPRDAA